MESTRAREKVLRAYLEANRRVQAAQTRPNQYVSLPILNSFLGIILWGKDGRGEPRPMEEIASSIGITPTTFNEHVKYLGDRLREGKEGMGLIQTETYPLNRRMKTTRLTRKGQILADQITFILQGVNQSDHSATSGEMASHS
jgi:DNA-binding MarR family transcriptional regulator